MDYTLNIVSKCCFPLYLNIRGLQKGPGKFFMGVLESPGKVLDFLSVKDGNLVVKYYYFYPREGPVRAPGL